MSTIRSLEDRSRSDSRRVLRHFVREQIVLPMMNTVGRLVTKPRRDHFDSMYLNLGCGATTFDGWINADAFKLDKLLRREEPRPDWMLDATKPWPCDEGIFAGVYCEHVIEHLSYSAAISLLRESFRALQPGGRIRVSAPDIEVHVRHYCGAPVDPRFEAEYVTPIHGLSVVTQEWGHVSSWDAALAVEVLTELGFTNARAKAFRESDDPELARDSEDRRWQSFYVEAQKPSCE